MDPLILAVGTAVLAEASRRAPLRDLVGARETLAEALLLCVAFAAPAAAGLLVLGPPIADLHFLWGRHMDPARTAAIGLTIRWFAPAVVFYCAVKVVVPFFHAQGRIRVPLLASLAAVVCNIACALLAYPALRWNGLALAVGVGQVANLAVLLSVAGALHGWPRPALVARLGKIALASVVSGAAAQPVFERQFTKRASTRTAPSPALLGAASAPRRAPAHGLAATMVGVPRVRLPTPVSQRAVRAGCGAHLRR